MKKLTFLNSVIIGLLTLLITFQAHAQQASKGRTNGVVIDVSGRAYAAIKKIRKLINQQEYDAAAKRAIKLIKSEETGFKRSGLSMSDYYYEAYNCLCVSSTELRKVDYAMEACNKSLALSPKSWESYKSRATLHFMTQNYEKSLSDFKLALEHSPEKLPEVGEVLKQNIAVVQSKL